MFSKQVEGHNEPSGSVFRFDKIPINNDSVFGGFRKKVNVEVHTDSTILGSLRLSPDETDFKKRKYILIKLRNLGVSLPSIL